MNSYPPELLAQLAPIMFVAGLDVPPPPESTPQSPPPKPTDPFVLLSLRLREALTAQRKVAIWQPERAKTFQVVLVDPEVRFPPRKLPPPEDQQFHPVHSPLSPLTPSSPLYPDGLIAPIWIRKHTTLVPSVFVLFKRIYEYPHHSGAQSPLDLPDMNRDKDREAEERRKDTELSAEVAQRKRSTNERSIKLTVVLMASRKLLDDPSLDARLTYIRRQSGLDPRAALFVLSPVTQSEIGDFVRSLQEALYEPALEYYTNHSKRVRRKRNKHSQANVMHPNLPMSPSNIPRPLRPEGWTVRYEYKMACFAEFRGEDDVALKHYQDAYNALHIMFGSTAILPPRTKRWAEAKVLADTISVKMCKLYLYNNEHALALGTHNTHMRRFSDLSRGWGIGEETFEFWSWLARQHRVFAELLEQGTRSNLQIPSHLPAPPALAQNPSTADAPIAKGMELDSARILGLNPSQALQHPGFYYYLAAQCTEQRRERFMRALNNPNIPNVTASPGYVNEKKVDHLTIILELYTRAYELFKKYSPSNSQGRLTLWIAYRIAHTYYESGKFDMAIRFFERIAKTYRREQWGAMLQPLLTTWYKCAQQRGDMELSVQLLLEMLGHGADEDQEDGPEALEEDVLAVLNSTVPLSSEQALVVDLSESGPLLDTTVLFWKPEVHVGEATAFQICLAAPETISLTALPLTSLTIHFSGDIPPLTIEDTRADSDGGLQLIQHVSLGKLTGGSLETPPNDPIKCNLRWRPGACTVFYGAVTSQVPVTISVSKIVLTAKQGAWWIELPMHANSTRPGVIPNLRWLSSFNPVRFISMPKDAHTSLSIRHRPHRVSVSLKHEAPSYLGEEFPIVIDVTNGDDQELDIVVDVLLHPTEVEYAVNFMRFDGQESPSLVKGVSFGMLAPGVNATKTLHLISSGATGDRVLDISVQSREKTLATLASPVTPQSPAALDVGETLRTLTIPTVQPISAEFDVTYRRSTKEVAGVSNLASYQGDYWEDAGEAHVVTTLTCVGHTGVVVESVKLVREDGQSAKVIDSVIDEDGEDFLTEWLPGDEFSDYCRISLALTEDSTIPGPGYYEVSWRRLLPGSERGTLSTSKFPLPSLKPPDDGLIALLDVPGTAKLHEPIPIHLIVRNGNPIKSSNIIVQLEPDPSDSFVVAGVRMARLPILLPGSEERLTWNLIPIECGFVKIPKLKVTDRRQNVGSQGQSGHEQPPENEGVEVEIVDIRSDGSPGLTTTDAARVSTDIPKIQDPQNPAANAGVVVLVLP